MSVARTIADTGRQAWRGARTSGHNKHRGTPARARVGLGRVQDHLDG
jgi:hypothetical protein